MCAKKTFKRKTKKMNKQNIEKQNEVNEGMVFYKAFFDGIEMLPDNSTKAQCYRALINYGIYGALPECDDNIVKTLFALAKPLIDANIARYKKSVANGRKRGGQPGNQNARKKP